MSRYGDAAIDAKLRTEREAAERAAAAAETARLDALGRAKAALPRVSVPAVHIERLRTANEAVRILLGQIAADYIKLSPSHKQRCGEVRTALDAVVAAIEGDQAVIAAVTPSRAATKRQTQKSARQTNRVRS